MAQVALIGIPVLGLHPQVEQRAAGAPGDGHIFHPTGNRAPKPKRARIMPPCQSVIADQPRRHSGIGKTGRIAWIVAGKARYRQPPGTAKQPCGALPVTSAKRSICPLLQPLPTDVEAVSARSTCRRTLHIGFRCQSRYVGHRPSGKYQLISPEGRATGFDNICVVQQFQRQFGYWSTGIAARPRAVICGFTDDHRSLPHDRPVPNLEKWPVGCLSNNQKWGETAPP